MVIIGAKGHAKEVLDILNKKEALVFFDNVSLGLPEKLFNQYPIITTEEEVLLHFKEDARFILGLGSPHHRELMYNKMVSLGGNPESVIALTALLSSYDLVLSKGLNIMHHVILSSCVNIGIGSLINAGVNVHHDSRVGDFCEISPKVTITGGVEIGNNVFIGAGSTILPKIKIADNVIIGAGSVITKNIDANSVMVGVPAKCIRKL